MPSSHLILCHPFLLLPPIPPSIRVFSSESALYMKWPKYWSFSFSISPSSEHPGLISFRMDWLDLLAAQGTLKSLLQYHSSKASIFQCSAFLTVQLSHPYMTTGKTIALTFITMTVLSDFSDSTVLLAEVEVLLKPGTYICPHDLIIHCYSSVTQVLAVTTNSLHFCPHVCCHSLENPCHQVLGVL